MSKLLEIVWTVGVPGRFKELYFSESVMGKDNAELAAKQAAKAMNGKAIRCQLIQMQ